jgi:hypothetical protein
VRLLLADLQNKMNTKANVVTQIFVLLIIVVATSAVVLIFIKIGIIPPHPDNEQVEVLNTEFIPFEREGVVAISGFAFCNGVDSQFKCLTPTREFRLGQQIHFRFAVESSTSSNQVYLIENYRIRGPDNQILLDIEDENNFYVEKPSNKAMETVTFRDYFTVTQDQPTGEYTLELLITNPLLKKKTTLVERFEVRG